MSTCTWHVKYVHVHVHVRACRAALAVMPRDFVHVHVGMHIIVHSAKVMPNWSISGDVEQAFHVLHHMHGSGYPANVRTFTELISACCKAGSLDAAFGLLYQMVAEGVEPSRVTYDIMLRAACVANNPNRFQELKNMVRCRNRLIITFH